MARTQLTEPDTNGQLEPEQELALDALIAGATDARAADAAGVTRQTVNGWRNHNPAFIAALNDRRQAIWQGHADRVRGLVGMALDVLAEDLADTAPDARKARQAAAVHVLRSAGLYGASLAPDGPTDTEDVMRKQREKKSKDRQADMFYRL